MEMAQKAEQPPPRGCVLKPNVSRMVIIDQWQPPPRGCVLKLPVSENNKDKKSQPPPRGCVLKPLAVLNNQTGERAAASARLCVETPCDAIKLRACLQPPPRGCVLKHYILIGCLAFFRQPPPRGCVLKLG